VIDRRVGDFAALPRLAHSTDKLSQGKVIDIKFRQWEVINISEFSEQLSDQTKSHNGLRTL